MGDCFVFGKETTGLPSKVIEEGRRRGEQEGESRLLEIPLWGPLRSLNLATAVAVVLYEALRQTKLCGIVNKK